MAVLRPLSLVLMPVVIAGTGIAVRRRRRNKVPDAAKLADSRYVASWPEIREILASFGTELAHDGAQTYVNALEAICGGRLDYGYVAVTRDRIDGAVVCDERFFGFEILPKGKVGAYSGYVGQITSLKLTTSRDKLRLDVRYDPGPGWQWEAPKEQDALPRFAAELGKTRANSLHVHSN